MLGRGDEDDELLALYALDALEGPEREAVERAVASSPQLAERLESFRTTSAALGGSVAAEPPPDLKQRVLAAAFAESPPRAPESLDAPSVVVDLDRRRRRRVPTWQLGLAAASIAVALLIGASLIDQPADQSAEAVLIGQGGSMVVVADDDRILVSGSDLDPLRDDQTYELWLVADDGTVRSVGLFAPSSDGTVDAALSGDLGDATGLAVSLEPSGGSPDPNGPTGPVTFDATIVR